MPKIRILIVDDSIVIRKALSEIITQDPQLTVVGTSPNGKIALEKIPQVNPDLITLDVEMPEMDGLATVAAIRKTYAKLPVIMVSAFTEAGVKTTFKALAAGATDYVTKPAGLSAVEAMSSLREQLIPKIKAHCKHLLPLDPPPERTGATQRGAVASSAHRGRRMPFRADVVCIGVSTGGPNALTEIFAEVVQTIRVPMVIVQHMPPVFTRALAEKLNTLKSSVQFHEGEEGMAIESGHAYIAPGGKHMELRRQGTQVVIRLHEGPPENSCRPAVDVLFRSVLSIYGGNTLAIVLTGMGQDGLHGCEAIAEAGGRIMVQDEASSVVWGMPGFVAKNGLADEILPLREVAARLVLLAGMIRDRGALPAWGPGPAPTL